MFLIKRKCVIFFTRLCILTISNHWLKSMIKVSTNTCPKGLLKFFHVFNLIRIKTASKLPSLLNVFGKIYCEVLLFQLYLWLGKTFKKVQFFWIFYWFGKEFWEDHHFWIYFLSWKRFETYSVKFSSFKYIFGWWKQCKDLGKG